MLSKGQYSISVNSAYFSQDGIVTLKLSDKRILKLPVQFWIDLNQPFKKSLSDSQLEILEHEASYFKIKVKILRLLAVREHSVFELRKKLKQSFFKSGISNFTLLFERCILEMQKNNFQSDERFTRNFVESKLINKQIGPFKILQDLSHRGIAPELAQTVLNELVDREIWVEKAVDCLENIQKKVKTMFEKL